MKKIASAIAATTALVLATGALAEAHEEAADGPPVHYQFEGTMSEVTLVGGLGDEIYGASWNETLIIGEGDDAMTVTGRCVGMDQPGNSMFDRHFTCTHETADGESKGAVLFGCSVNEETSAEMRCYGHFEGKEGGVEGHAAMETAYYRFMPDGTGKIVGSGQWYK